MARYALIDNYLDAMRHGLHWRRDLDDLVSEMEDHLYSTVEHMCSAGQEPAVAERAALNRFGDPKTLASVYASTTNGGLAMPTNFTRLTGLLAITAAPILTIIAIASALSFAAALGAPFGSWDGDGDWQIYYMLGTFGLLASSAMMTILVLGLKRRTGVGGFIPVIAIVSSTVGSFMTLVAWFIPGWAIPLGLATLLMALTVLRAGVGPVIPTVLYGAGFLAGSATFLVLRAATIGKIDEWGDYPAAWNGGVAVACAVTAVGLLGLGRWLRSEEPADIDSMPIAA